MINKSMVNDILKGYVKEDFIKLWWGLRLPGLGKMTPNEVWETNPGRVLEYARGYLDVSFS